MYTNNQINQFVDSQGIGSNPYAMYVQARQNNVNPYQVDSARGWDAGTSANWIQQNGLAPWQAQAPQDYTNDQINQFIDQKGIGDNPWAMYSYAQQFGVDPSRIDAARGWDAGTSNKWIQQNNLSPIRTQQTLPGVQTGGQTGGQVGGQTGGQANPGQQNPYLQGQIDSLTTDVTNNLNERILPQLRRGQVANGTLGSTRQGIAEGQAIGDTNRGLSSAISNLRANQFNADRNYGLQNDALDLSVYNANQGWANQGYQNQMNLMSNLMNWNQQGVNNATQVQNTPLNYWQQFANAGTQLGGMGGTQSQTMQGNPWLGAIGGAMAGYNLYNNWGK